MTNVFLSGPALEAIFGCMFSYKTDEVVKRIKQLQYARLCGQTFLPVRDTRTERSLEIAFSNTIRIKKLIELIDFSKKHPEIHVLAVDEFQFFLEETLLDVVEMVDRIVIKDRKRLIISGLDTDFRGRPFGPMPWVIAMATDRSPQLAICTKCGQHNATRSQRIVKSNKQLLVGDNEDYEARCINCYDPPLTTE